jgi:hypothetical protein
MIGLCVSLGLCSLSSFTPTIGGVSLFTEAIVPKHACAKDLLSAVLDTCLFFMDGAYACFQEGSIKPLFYGSNEHLKASTVCGKIEDYILLAKAGKYSELQSMDTAALRKEIQESEKYLEQMVKTSKSSSTRRMLQMKLDKVQTLRREFFTFQATGEMREAPFATTIHGPSGVGKSYVLKGLQKLAFELEKMGFDPRLISTILEKDKFWSTWVLETLIAVLEDLNNIKIDLLNEIMQANLILLNNNVAQYVPKAEIELKGTIQILCKYLMITTNTKDLGAHDVSNEPFSIIRRGGYFIKTIVRPEFANPDGTLSKKAMQARFGDAAPSFPDVWLFTVELPICQVARKGMTSKGFGWEIVTFDGTPNGQKNGECGFPYPHEVVCQPSQGA